MSSILSLVLFGEGIVTGITLTVMLGPVTMIILRYGMQVNRAAGVWAATGTWISDLVFITSTFWLTESLSQWTEDESIRFWIYMIGGISLTLMGIILMRTKRNPPALMSELKATKSYTQAFAGGFLVNSLSPFTLFFWLGVALLLHMQDENPFWYYAGLMLSLAFGDFAKAWLAPKLVKWIKEKYVYWVQVGAGVVIAVSGIYIIGMGFFEK
jgi:threonine/homoserine/homoserine lactone efflux protein